MTFAVRDSVVECGDESDGVTALAQVGAAIRQGKHVVRHGTALKAAQSAALQNLAERR